MGFWGKDTCMLLMHMSMVTSKRGLNIPAGFDISLSKFGHFFHPGAKFLYKLPHPWEIPKISKQNNLKLF